MLKMNWKHKLKNGNKDENLSKKKKKKHFHEATGSFNNSADPKENEYWK